MEQREIEIEFLVWNPIINCEYVSEAQNFQNCQILKNDVTK